MNIRKKIIFSAKVLLSFVFVLSVSFVAKPAIRGVAVAPFGGEITASILCTCSLGQLITVGPPMGGTFVFQVPGSIPFPMGQFYRPGPFILGNYTPGAVCMMVVPTGCAPNPITPIGTIEMAGTSL